MGGVVERDVEWNSRCLSLKNHVINGHLHAFFACEARINHKMIITIRHKTDISVLTDTSAARVVFTALCEVGVCTGLLGRDTTCGIVFEEHFEKLQSSGLQSRHQRSIHVASPFGE